MWSSQIRGERTNGRCLNRPPTRREKIHFPKRSIPKTGRNRLRGTQYVAQESCSQGEIGPRFALPLTANLCHISQSSLRVGKMRYNARLNVDLEIGAIPRLSATVLASIEVRTNLQRTPDARLSPQDVDLDSRVDIRGGGRTRIGRRPQKRVLDRFCRTGLAHEVSKIWSRPDGFEKSEPNMAWPVEPGSVSLESSIRHTRCL